MSGRLSSWRCAISSWRRQAPGGALSGSRRWWPTLRPCALPLDDTTEGHQGKEMQQTLMTLTKKTSGASRWIIPSSCAEHSGCQDFRKSAGCQQRLPEYHDAAYGGAVGKGVGKSSRGGKGRRQADLDRGRPHVATGLNDHAAPQSAVSSSKPSADAAVSQAAAALTENMTVSATDRNGIHDPSQSCRIRRCTTSSTVPARRIRFSCLFRRFQPDAYDPVTGEITTHSGDDTAVKNESLYGHVCGCELKGDNGMQQFLNPGAAYRIHFMRHDYLSETSLMEHRFFVSGAPSLRLSGDGRRGHRDQRCVERSVFA